MAWATPRTWTVGQLVTAAALNQDVRDNLNFLYSRLTLGYLETFSNTGLVTTETVVLSAPAVTVVAGRRIRISAQYASAAGSVIGDTYNFNIKEGATFLNAKTFRVSGGSDGIYVAAVILPSAGVHTYSATLVRTSGTGSINGQAAATYPAFIHVEDCGV